MYLCNLYTCMFRCLFVYFFLVRVPFNAIVLGLEQLNLHSSEIKSIVPQCSDLLDIMMIY